MELLAVDFREGHPHTIFVRDGDLVDMHDVEYCRRDDCYYAEESGGGDVYFHNPYWATHGVAVKEYSDARRMDEMPSGWTADRLIEIIEHYGETPCGWCSECGDHIPFDDPCDHIRWCNECEQWITPDDACVHRA